MSYSHTHAGPHSTDGPLRKLAGTMRTIFDKERLYIGASRPARRPPRMVARELVPVRVAAGSTRRARHLGQPPRAHRGRPDDPRLEQEVPLDDELTVLKLDTADGRSTLAWSNFACHPVVLGGENPNVGPDYPGALRALVERNLGCTASS